MAPVVLFYIALSTGLPVVIALLLWAARQHMWQTIALLSLLALALGLASVLMLNIEYRSLGIDPGYFYGHVGPGPDIPSADTTLALYATYEIWRSIVVSASLALASAAWIIAIYQTIQSRRWRWLAAIVFGASSSGFLALFAQN